MRYKLPGTKSSQLINQAINTEFEIQSLQTAHTEIQFAIAVAAFAQKLRNEDHIGDYSYDDMITLATRGRGRDPYGYRAELIELLRRAKELDQ